MPAEINLININKEKKLTARKIEFCIYLCLIFLIYACQFHHWNGMYVDTDNYMYALRAIDWLQHPTWLEQKFMLSNYPFGEVRHWTRLMDILIALCSLPFIWTETLKQAVFHGGLLLTPIFLVLTFICFAKISMKILDARGRVILFLLLWVQDCFMKAFLFNRPDHHAVHIFLTVLAVWLLIKYILSQNEKTLTYVGLACALFLWTAAEGIICFGLVLAFLYGGYLWFNYPYKVLKKTALSFAFFTMLFWLINPPQQGWLYLDNGRLSVLFVVVAWYIFGVIFALEKITQKKLHVVMSFVLCLLLVGGLWLKGYLSLPLDESIQAAFVSRISEMQEGTKIYNLIYPITALILFWVLWYRKGANREILWLLAILGSGYLFLCLWSVRFCSFEAVFSSLIIAYWISGKNMKNVAFGGLAVLLVSLEFIGFIITSAFKYDLTEKISATKIFDTRILSEYPFKNGSVVTDVFMAPYVIWFSGRPTITSPYHTNIEGIVDNHNILFSTDEDEVMQLLLKHQVKTIILPMFGDAEYFVNPEHNCNKLYGKILGCHNYPIWLKETASSKEKNYIVLEVDDELIRTFKKEVE